MTMRLNQSQVSGISSPYPLAAEEHLWQGTLIGSCVLDIFHQCSLGDLTLFNRSLYLVATADLKSDILLHYYQNLNIFTKMIYCIMNQHDIRN
jgi:hypothetical protein